MPTGPIPACGPAAVLAANGQSMTLRSRRVHRQREGRSAPPVTTRQEFLELTRQALQTRPEGLQRVGVVCVGLSGFREVVTKELAAEQVLLGVTERWLQRLRAGDVLGHVGVDRFAFLCTGPASDIMSVADRLATALEDPVALAQGRVKVSGAMGVVIAEPDLLSPEDLLERCGRVMRSGGRQRQVRNIGWPGVEAAEELPEPALAEAGSLDVAINRIFAASLEIASVDALSDHAAQDHLSAAVAELDAAIVAIRRSVYSH
jgi:GGDEF domain-containing protein